ncbi:MAG: hypothetical protein M1832_002088 [Thelocarpon impressellum]|nr:MAG: hypothetical protein M1832_002088 [Thelocarpon impressellum]
MLSLLSLLFLVPLLLLTSPLNAARPQLVEQPQTIIVSPLAVLQIAPGSSSCVDGNPAECRDAFQAAQILTTVLRDYNVTEPRLAAALIALVAFESNNFRDSRNRFPPPGQPGQGTRNMQTFEFNLKYATSVPALGAEVARIAGGRRRANDFSAEAKSALLDLLLLDDVVDFASAAWYLRERCDAGFTDGLIAGTEAGWEDYLRFCIETDPTEERRAYWLRALQALVV